MRFRYVNNDDRGQSAPVELSVDPTVGDFLVSKLGEDWSEDYTARINREPASNDELVPDGARLSVTHRKQDGS